MLEYDTEQRLKTGKSHLRLKEMMRVNKANNSKVHPLDATNLISRRQKSCIVLKAICKFRRLAVRFKAEQHGIALRGGNVGPNKLFAVSDSQYAV